MRIGIVAALPGELKPLVRGWLRMPVAKGSGISMWQSERGGYDLVATCGGIGVTAAMRAFAAAEHAGSLDAVFSVGWAGGLTNETQAGKAYSPSEVIDAQTGERMPSLPGQYPHRLVTSAHVAQEPEKRRMAKSYEATLVDMEAAAISRLAQMRAIPFYCVKGVSDDLSLNLPDLNPFIDRTGRLRMDRFLAYGLFRPQYWASLMRLGANSGAAARAIAESVNSILENRFLGDAN